MSTALNSSTCYTLQPAGCTNLFGEHQTVVADCQHRACQDNASAYNKWANHSNSNNHYGQMPIISCAIAVVRVFENMRECFCFCCVDTFPSSLCYKITKCGRSIVELPGTGCICCCFDSVATKARKEMNDPTGGLCRKLTPLNGLPAPTVHTPLLHAAGSPVKPKAPSPAAARSPAPSPYSSKSSSPVSPAAVPVAAAAPAAEPVRTPVMQSTGGGLPTSPLTPDAEPKTPGFNALSPLVTIERGDASRT